MENCWRSAGRDAEGVVAADEAVARAKANEWFLHMDQKDREPFQDCGRQRRADFQS